MDETPYRTGSPPSREISAPARRKVRVDEPMLALLMAAAALVGLFGPLLAVTAPAGPGAGAQWLLATGLVVLLAAAGLVGITTWDAAPLTSQPPRGGEFLLAGVGMVLIWAVAGLVMLVFYVVAFGTTTGVGLLLAWTAPTPAAGPTSQLAGLPHTVGGVAAFIIGAVGGFVALAGSLFNAVNQLYPAAAGVRSPFWQPALLLAERPLPLANRDFWRQSRLLHLTAVGGILVAAAGVTALLYVALIPVWLAWLLLALCQLGLVAASWGCFAPDAIPTPDAEALQAIQKLLDAAGYRTLPTRTGDETLDPLLLDIDFLAHNEALALAIDVKTMRESQEPVSLAAVSGLRMACWTCEDERAKLNLGPAPIRPQVIVVDREVGPEARAFAAESRVAIVELSGATLADIRRTTSLEKLRLRAASLWGPAGAVDAAVVEDGGQP